MTEQELIRKLNSVGKTIFIEYFGTFQSYANEHLTKENCMELLVSDKVSNESGAAIRCSNAILIFKAKMECEALRIVSKSNRLPSNIIVKAKELIKEYCR